MSVAIITGSAGLVGSEAVAYFDSLGMDVVGIDNGMRAEFFGPDASTAWVRDQLTRDLPAYRHYEVDIRDAAAIDRVFERYGSDISLIVHTAAQPSHDWAASNPTLDFTVNANGTSVLLEATRKFAHDAVFIFTSTNKVYGDTPNHLPLVEQGTRWELDPSHPYAKNGIPETMSIDHTTHSLFGASKVAADVLVQEYGRYFGMKTACFRGGCLTGPRHSGTQLHGFLAYLMKCTVTGTPYTVFGYGGKQVRDNIHCSDMVSCFESFQRAPRAAAVYNMGGGRRSNCSMLEAIEVCERISGRELQWELSDEARIGDHRWWVSDVSDFAADYSDWQPRYGIDEILQEMFEQNVERWMAKA